MPAHPDTYATFYDFTPSGKVDPETWVELKIKGNRNTSISKPATEQLKRDYPFAWNAYKNNSFELCDGTPLRALPGMSPSQVAEFNTLGIGSVEALSDITDAVADNIKGGRTLRTRAQAYLAAMNAEEPEDDSGDLPQPIAKKKAKKKGKKKVTKRTE